MQMGMKVMEAEDFRSWVKEQETFAEANDLKGSGMVEKKEN
jgi:heme/copper-type cytochrome/quinol oxidase subunit 2